MSKNNSILRPAAFAIFLLCIAALLLRGRKTPAERDFLIKVNASIKTGNPSNIKKEVLAILSGTNLNSDELEKNIPEDISSLPVFAGPGTEILAGGVPGLKSDYDRGLSFMVGSGFGHWGIVVFPFGDGETMKKQIYGKTFPWKEGVYFWIEE